MSTHSVPLHCPYCAGERLHPHGDSHGAWECRECLRAFSVRFLGLLNPSGGHDDRR
jgi:transposase-like protein